MNALTQQKTYRLKIFKENGKEYEARVHYGAGRLTPNLSCTCELKEYRCDHKQALLDGMNSVDWLIIESGWGDKRHTNET